MFIEGRSFRNSGFRDNWKFKVEALEGKEVAGVSVEGSLFQFCTVCLGIYFGVSGFWYLITSLFT